VPATTDDADDGAEGYEAQPSEHGSDVDLSWREGGEREIVAEREDADAEGEGDEGADGHGVADVQIVDAQTGEPVPAAKIAEAERMLGEAGLGEHSWEDYLAAKKVLGELRPEDDAGIGSFVEVALGAKLSPEQLKGLADRPAC
jgi:hypothetical protein